MKQDLFVKGVQRVLFKVCSVYCTRCAMCIVQGLKCVLYKVCSVHCTRYVVCIVKGGQYVLYNVCRSLSRTAISSVNKENFISNLK